MELLGKVYETFQTQTWKRLLCQIGFFWLPLLFCGWGKPFGKSELQCSHKWSRDRRKNSKYILILGYTVFYKLDCSSEPILKLKMWVGFVFCFCLRVYFCKRLCWNVVSTADINPMLSTRSWWTRKELWKLLIFWILYWAQSTCHWSPHFQDRRVKELTCVNEVEFLSQMNKYDYNKCILISVFHRDFPLVKWNVSVDTV